MDGGTHGWKSDSDDHTVRATGGGGETGSQGRGGPYSGAESTSRGDKEAHQRAPYGAEEVKRDLGRKGPPKKKRPKT